MRDIENSPLGKASAYAANYDPALLFPIPRIAKRQELGLTGRLPFFGADYWNAYELSWLNAPGKPQIALATFVFPADSPNIVESKSLKLYLNSFNQTRFANIGDVAASLAHDLSQAADAAVQVHLKTPDQFVDERIAELDGYCIDQLDLDIDNFRLDPSSLQVEAQQVPIEETLTSHLLKSNCLITGQPDWASIQIRYRGRPIQREGLLRYLISFRQHNEFHEQCVERIFIDIQQHCQPAALSVYARYTRRGGLDINPFRTSFSQAGPVNIRTARQ